MDGIGADEIMAAAPDTVPKFLSNYKMPRAPAFIDISSTYIQKTVAESSTELFSTMSKLDSRWFLADRNGEDVIDMKSMANLSTDARRLLEDHPVIGHAVQMAPKYLPASASEVIREQYPRMVDLA